MGALSYYFPLKEIMTDRPTNQPIDQHMDMRVALGSYASNEKGGKINNVVCCCSTQLWILTRI